MALDYKEMLALLAPESCSYIEWLRTLGCPPVDRLSVEEARDVMRRLQSAGLRGHAVTTERRTVDDFSVVMVRPDGVTGTLPAMVYFHGGGWVLGDFDTHARMVAEIAVRSRSAIVFVEYARASGDAVSSRIGTMLPGARVDCGAGSFGRARRGAADCCRRQRRRQPCRSRGPAGGAPWRAGDTPSGAALSGDGLRLHDRELSGFRSRAQSRRGRHALVLGSLSARSRAAHGSARFAASGLACRVGEDASGAGDYGGVRCAA